MILQSKGNEKLEKVLVEIAVLKKSLNAIEDVCTRPMRAKDTHQADAELQLNDDKQAKAPHEHKVKGMYRC